MCAFAVLVNAQLIAVWLYAYEVRTTVEFIDARGERFRPSYSILEQPWWSVPAAFAVILLGGALAIGLVPELRNLPRGLAHRFAKPS